MTENDPKANGIPGEKTGEQVIAFEAEPPGPDEVECLIEPAEPPDEDEDQADGQADEQAPSLPDAESAGPTEPADRGEAAERTRKQRARKTTTGPRMVVAIASGKGGTGKSLLAASLGIFLAQIGKQVVLVDANLGSGNLHTLLGMKQPEVSLHAFLSKQIKQIEDVIVETPFRGLGLAPSNANAVGTANPKQAQKTRLLHQIRALDVDFVILDLPAGSAFNTLDLFLAADLHVVVTVPEPTAVESAFRLIKSAFVRKLRNLKGLGEILSELQPTAHFGIPTPNQLLEAARKRNPKIADDLGQAMAAFKPRLVMNKTRTREDLEIGPTLAVVGRRHLALPFDYLGYMENDDVVWVTVRKRRPLLVEYPEAKISKDIERVTRRILKLEHKERPECVGRPKSLSIQNHYEILGLHPGATEEEVRRAQRRVRRIYSPDSSSVFGIVPPDEVSEMLTCIDTAHATLVDPEKRQLYDQDLFAEEPEAQPAAEEEPAPLPIQEGVLEEADTTPLEPLPDMPAISPETPFSGALLRAVREARGVDLQDIAGRTKISKTYLNAIEEEDYLAAPAPVYLRGFVKTLAKDLKLDPEQVARSYMERYQASEEK
jgi:flagellar biosynthesis protein FlhG